MPSISGQRNLIKLQKTVFKSVSGIPFALNREKQFNYLKNYLCKSENLNYWTKGVNEIMQTNSLNTKISGVASKLIDKLMVVSGVIALVWILAFLLIAIMDKA